MKFLCVKRPGTNLITGDHVYGFDLTAPYDTSTLHHASDINRVLMLAVIQQAASQAGDFRWGAANKNHRFKV